MADDSTPDPGADPSSAPTPLVPCRSLRNKGMLVFNTGAYGLGDEDNGNTVYWCVRTMKSFGPDDEMVGREDCTEPGRTCYEPL